jgi:hypothetical protein
VKGTFEDQLAGLIARQMVAIRKAETPEAAGERFESVVQAMTIALGRFVGWTLVGDPERINAILEGVSVQLFEEASAVKR